MRLPIELLGIMFLLAVFLIWLVYLFISKWIGFKIYKPSSNKSVPDEIWLEKHKVDSFGINNDKSRKGERTGGDDSTTPESSGIVPEPSEVTERSSIQDVLAGKIRQDSHRLRNLLRRTKAKE